jgi:hypothetical protein
MIQKEPDKDKVKEILYLVILSQDLSTFMDIDKMIRKKVKIT